MDSYFISFISVEDDLDLIVSFAVIDPEDGSYLDSLIVIRTPKYERFFEPHERGPKVSFPLGDNAIESRNLIRVSYSEKDELISIECEGATYILDLSKVDSGEFDEMARVFRKMCAGALAKTSGL